MTCRGRRGIAGRAAAAVDARRPSCDGRTRTPCGARRKPLSTDPADRLCVVLSLADDAARQSAESNTDAGTQPSKMTIDHASKPSMTACAIRCWTPAHGAAHDRGNSERRVQRPAFSCRRLCDRGRAMTGWWTGPKTTRTRHKARRSQRMHTVTAAPADTAAVDLGADDAFNDPALKRRRPFRH